MSRKEQHCAVTHALAVVSPGQDHARTADELQELLLWGSAYCTEEFLICSFPNIKEQDFLFC